MSSLIESIQSYTAPYRSAIREGQPAGDDLSFDPEFEQAKTEIDKLTSLSGSQPNWSAVIDIGQRLLETRSKDMRLGCWIAVGRMQRSGWSGLAEGLGLIDVLVTNFWDTMFPDAKKRLRARANLIQWVVDQSAASLGAVDVGPSDDEPVRACELLIASLDTVLGPKLGELHPGFGRVRSLVREKLRVLDQVAATAAAEHATAEQQAPREPNQTKVSAVELPPAPIAVPQASGVQDAVPTVRAISESILRVAAMLRKADPTQVWAYRLQRVGAWISVQNAPPSEGKSTLIPPPLQDVRDGLQRLATGAKWTELLEQAEGLTGDYLFWFEPHRLVAVALEHLGALYVPAREAVGRDVVAFAQRFPSVVELGFEDGTPFADSATRAWLEEEALKWTSQGAAGPAAAPSSVNEEDIELEKRFELARQMIMAGNLRDGLAIASQVAVRAADERTRFRQHLQVAQLAIQGGARAVALPILQGLAQSAETHCLDTWEPALCVATYVALYNCLKVASGSLETSSPGETQRLAIVFEKLCRLDPASALQLSGEGRRL